eukprot:6436983-Amphidinium_carterae.1
MHKPAWSAGSQAVRTWLQRDQAPAAQPHSNRTKKKKKRRRRRAAREQEKRWVAKKSLSGTESALLVKPSCWPDGRGISFLGV